MTGKELDKSFSGDIIQPGDSAFLPLTIGENVLVRLPTEGLSMDEVELIANTQAHLREVEELAKSKGVGLGMQPEKEKGEPRFSVDLRFYEDTHEVPVYEGTFLIIPTDRKKTTRAKRKTKKDTGSIST